MRDKSRSQKIEIPHKFHLFSQNATVGGNISKPLFKKKKERSIFGFLTNIDRLCVGLMVKVTVEKRPATPDINLERVAQFKNRSKVFNEFGQEVYI